ncbi:MAG: hypothetical protein KAR42_16780 [candidate division Zixibacteria bacterium]|nr:hypothetical protein [candidate division Zixibacteria bacterium]
MKIKVTPELIEKATRIFKTAKNGIIFTGRGLTRQELRALERDGMIKRKSARFKKSGSTINAWHINPSFGNLYGKKTQVLKSG